MMHEICPSCGNALQPFRGKLRCRLCGYHTHCCEGTPQPMTALERDAMTSLELMHPPRKLITAEGEVDLMSPSITEATDRLQPLIITIDNESRHGKSKSTIIDMTGVDRRALIAESYDLSHACGMGWLHFEEGRLTEKELDDLMPPPLYKHVSLSLDYVKGRAVKMTVFKAISNFHFNTPPEVKEYMFYPWYDHADHWLEELLKRVHPAYAEYRKELEKRKGASVSERALPE